MDCSRDFDPTQTMTYLTFDRLFAHAWETGQLSRQNLLQVINTTIEADNEEISQAVDRLIYAVRRGRMVWVD
jgi:hypothetical protein